MDQNFWTIHPITAIRYFYSKPRFFILWLPRGSFLFSFSTRRFSRICYTDVEADGMETDTDGFSLEVAVPSPLSPYLGYVYQPPSCITPHPTTEPRLLACSAVSTAVPFHFRAGLDLRSGLFCAFVCRSFVD